jgi:hypothetical protein
MLPATNEKLQEIMSNYPLKIIVPPVLMCFLMLAGGCNQQLAKQKRLPIQKRRSSCLR